MRISSTEKVADRLNDESLDRALRQLRELGYVVLESVFPEGWIPVCGDVSFPHRSKDVAHSIEYGLNTSMLNMIQRGYIQPYSYMSVFNIIHKLQRRCTLPYS